MLIISVEIMETIEERGMQKTTKEKQTKTERWKGNKSYSESVTVWPFKFSRAYKLGFLQLICKASLIFKSHLELALSIILKRKELYESRHVVEECRCLKIRHLLSFLICSSILVLKWRKGLPIQLAQVNLYTSKDFKSLGIGCLYAK